LANPIASILSAAMLLEYSLKQKELARKIFRAVEGVLNDGFRTADIAKESGNVLSTEEMGRRIEAAL
jgi:3-isopropylmalate dehydrogenase